MRHAITVVGSREQGCEPARRVRLKSGEGLRETVWYACENQENRSHLLDDTGSVVLRLFRAPLLAYRFYVLVHTTRLWSGRRPLILVRGRTLSSRLAAYAGTWGGGDVVKANNDDARPLGPTRYLLMSDGHLEIRAD